MKSNQLSIEYFDSITSHRFKYPISILKKPRNIKDYAKLEKILDELIDKRQDNSKHPLAELMQIIGENLEQYDNENHPSIESDVSNITMVKYLMKAHNLYQSDLADIFGGQANVSRFLNGERELSKKQIKGLKEKFGISADFWIK